jgi:uncharacterized membrane protein YfcA
MPETATLLLGQVLQFEGLSWLICAAALSGLVRGFSGFGTALIFMPVAGQFLPPFWAVITLIVMDVFGPVPNLPRAWRSGHPRAVFVMAFGMVSALPLGLFLLKQMDPLLFRYLVATMALTAPLLLMMGFRFSAEAVKPPLLYVTGAFSGFLGGLVGIPGPPVIILYMSSRLPVRIIRANTMMFLFLFDVLLLLCLLLQGDLVALPVVIGLSLIIPSLLGNILGGFVFNPEKESLYRWVAYSITLVAGVTSLPVWD